MKFQVSLKNILTFNFVMVGLLPFLLFGMVYLRFFSQSLSDEITRKNLLVARSLADEVDRMLNEPLTLMAHLADLVKDGRVLDPEKQTAYLEMLVRQYSILERIFILDENARVIRAAPADPTYIGMDMSRHPFARQARTLQKPYWSKVFISAQTGEPSLALSYPMGRRLVAAYLNLRTLRTIIQKVDLHTSGFALMTNRKGAVIAHPESRLVYERTNLKNMMPVKKGVDGQEGSFRFHYNGTESLGSVVHVPRTGWLVVVTVSADEAFAPVFKVNRMFWSGLFATALLAFLVALASLKKALSPLVRLMATTRKVAQGDYRILPIKESYSELKGLMSDFESMAMAVRDREQALLEVQNRLELALKGADLGFWDWHVDTGQMVWHHDWLQKLGYAKGEIEPNFDAFINLIHPLDRSAVLKRLYYHLEGKLDAFHAEFQLATRSNGYRWISTRGKVVERLPNGEPARAAGTYVDVTPRRQAEQDRDRLFNLSPDLLCVIDVNGRVRQVNPACTRVLGWPRNLLLAAPFSEFVHPDDREKTNAALAKALAGSLELTGFENRLLCQDGSVRWLSWNTTLESQDRLVFAFGRDVTEFKKVQAAISETEARFKELAEMLPETIFEVDAAGTLTFINKGGHTHFGYDAMELGGGMNVVSLLEKNDRKRAFANLKRVLEGKKAEVEEYRAIRKNGSSFPVMIQAAPIVRGGQTEGLRGFIVDITRMKHLESQFHHAQRMEALGALSSGIAHDFNNLLMGIQGNISLISLNKAVDATNDERLKNIESYIQSATELTRRLLTLARGGSPRKAPTHPNKMISNNARMFGRTHKEIIIKEKLEKEVWNVSVDRGQMDQVFLNLFVNAWQAMPKGGKLTLETASLFLEDAEVKPYGVRRGRYVRFSVTDTGVGMDKETQRRIFDPFFTTKGKGRGTGLGLASAYGIIKNHGGFFTVYSEKGQGARFNIYIPASSESADVSAQLPPQLRKGEERVLLVDDEAMILDLGRQLLENLGHPVICAKSGHEALEIFSNQNPEIDLVILDMVMPEMNGSELFVEIKRINPETRVLLCSGYSMEGHAQMLMEKGCNGFLQKPFTLRGLSDKLREILDIDPKNPRS